MINELYKSLNELLEREQTNSKIIENDVSNLNQQISLFASSERKSALLNALIGLEKMNPSSKERETDLKERFERQNVSSTEYVQRIIENLEKLEKEC
jgi:hypothetical protein